MCLAHLLMTIFSFTTSINISVLHFGQYRGNLISTVSSYTFVLVLLPQVGQRTHKEGFSLSLKNNHLRIVLFCLDIVSLISIILCLCVPKFIILAVFIGHQHIM